MLQSLFGNLDPKKLKPVSSIPLANEVKPKKPRKSKKSESPDGKPKTKKRKSKKDVSFSSQPIDAFLTKVSKENNSVDKVPPDDSKKIIDLTKKEQTTLQSSVTPIVTSLSEEIVQTSNADSIQNIFRILKSSKRDPSAKIQDGVDEKNSSSPTTLPSSSLSSSLLIYQKYEPTDWNHFVGNNSAISKIRTWFGKVSKNPRYWPRALVIEGPVGVGKSLIPKLLAKDCGFERIHISCSSFWTEDSSGKFPGDEQKLSRIFTQVRSNCEKKILVLDDADEIFDSPATYLNYFFDSKKKNNDAAGVVSGWWADVQNEMVIPPPPMIIIFNDVYKSNIGWLRTMHKEYKDIKKERKYKKKKTGSEGSKFTKKVLKAKFVTLEKVSEREISQNLKRITKTSDLYYSDNEMGHIGRECFGDVRKSIIMLQEANWAFAIEKSPPPQKVLSKLSNPKGTSSISIFQPENENNSLEKEITGKSVADVKKISSVFSFWTFLINLPTINLQNQKQEIVQTNLDRINDVIEEWGSSDNMLESLIEGKYLHFFSNFHLSKYPISPILKNFHEKTHSDDLSLVSVFQAKRKNRNPDQQTSTKVNETNIQAKLLDYLKSHPDQERRFYSLSAIYQYYEGVSFGDYISSQLYRSTWDVDLVETKVTFEKTRPLLLLKSVCLSGLNQVNWNDEVKPIQDSKSDYWKNQEKVKSVMLHSSYLHLDDIEILGCSHALLLKIWYDWNHPILQGPDGFCFLGEPIDSEKNRFRYRVMGCRKSFHDVELPERKLKRQLDLIHEIKEAFLKSKTKVKPKDQYLEAYRDDYCWFLLSCGYGAATINNILAYWSSGDFQKKKSDQRSDAFKEDNQDNDGSKIYEIAKLMKKGIDASPPIVYRLDQFEKSMNHFGVFIMQKVTFNIVLKDIQTSGSRIKRLDISKLQDKPTSPENPIIIQDSNNSTEILQTDPPVTFRPTKKIKNELMIGSG